MKCLNVIVFYDNPEEVQNYIREVCLMDGKDVFIYIVVNSDKYNKVSPMVCELNESGIYNFKVVDYGRNVGYLNALLKVIQDVDVSQYLYFILSNTDIHYLTNDFFQKLAEKKYSGDIACIAPSVFAPGSFSYANPHYFERTSKRKFKRLVKIFTYPCLAQIYLKLSVLRAKETKRTEQPSCFVYSPHGCFMIFTLEFIKKLIGYEYGVKMYSEEACIGELLRLHEKKCFYDCELKIEHQESTVTGKMNYKNRFSEWRKSIEYILDTFYREG